MAISGVDPKCYILALFVRDDGVRFLLGDDPFEFKDKQLHFQPNTVANDVVEVQGNDGYLLAGQVRRPGTQMFDGYVCNGTNSKEEVEVKRRAFLQFFRRSHFYKVIYVFPNGTAIQRKQGFLVDDPTVQELYQQYPAYHVALNFEDVNYYTYEEDDEGHEIYAKEAIIKLAGGGATGGLIWDNNGVVWENQWGDIVTVSGVDFQVDNSLPVRVPIEATQLKGDTFQQTYSGKNLFNVAFSSEFVANDNNYFKLEKGVLRTVLFTFPEPLPAGTYTFSWQYSGTSTDTRIQPRIGSSSITTIYAHNETSHVVTASDAITSMYVYIGGSLPDGVTAEFMHFQIESGSSSTSYEPYTGGIPAPNPDYPQAVQVVTGEQNVWVHGKNLIDPTNLSFVYSNSPSQIGLSSIGNGIRMVNNGGASQNRFAVFRSIELMPYIGKVVRMKATFGASGGIRLYRIASDGSNRVSMASTTVSDTEISFTVPANLGASPYLGYVLDVTVGGGTTVDFTNLIMTVDSSLEPYEPYQGQSYPISLGSIELCKIGNYQDYIYKSGDDWYVHKELSSISFDGSENWNYASGSAQPFRYTITNARQLAQSQSVPPDVYSNYYTPYAWNNSSSVNYGVTASTNSSSLNIICFRNVDITSLADWKTWLSTHNTVVYYVLATATDTKITDATLMGQLEALDAIRLFIGENSILVSASSPNLPATLQFNYYTQYLEPHGAEWEEGGTKGATIVDVDAIDNTYPVWELIGPAINPTLSVLTTNTTLTYNGTITASQKLVIDMFNKTATLNGTSVIGNVTGDFVYMAPGTNRVAYTAGNADAPDSKISWQEVVG